jgi:hypothetical protein
LPVNFPGSAVGFATFHVVKSVPTAVVAELFICTTGHGFAAKNAAHGGSVFCCHVNLVFEIIYGIKKIKYFTNFQEFILN